jgi:hypothetical protein
MSFFDSEEELLGGVKLEFPITPDWLEKECEFTFVQFAVRLAAGGSFSIYVHDHSNVKIYMIPPRDGGMHWAIKVYHNNMLYHHQYISVRREFMDVVAKLRII